MSKRELFGGAISAVLPDHAVDASDIRQIPDNQEVFLTRENWSIIFEILAPVDDTTPDVALRTIFDALASDAEASSSTVETVQVLTPTRATLQGRQSIAKFNSTTADDVVVRMALWRIPADRGNPSELVCTLNAPVGTDDDRARATFETIVTSLEVHDYGLFG